MRQPGTLAGNGRVRLHSSRAVALWFVALLGAIVAAGAAQGAERSGWEFYRQALAWADVERDEVSREDALAAMEFKAYIWGAADMLQRDSAICVAQQVSNDALLATVYHALRDQPELRQMRRSAIVVEVLVAAYSCQQQPLPTDR